jgi:hypothetical protein
VPADEDSAEPAAEPQVNRCYFELPAVLWMG